MGAEQYFRCAVPQGDHLISECDIWNGRNTSKPKVSYFKSPPAINEEVMRLQISMKNAMTVAVGDPKQKLVHIRLKKVHSQNESMSHACI
mmetsp:Transcript_12949/g.19116  ORF Transcript_12949/g.19116 Transcript_12949/m.19116 type:complete len:90 (-) Transcript_12949:280-549(-)